MEEREDREAKFNAGIAKLERMGKLKQGCHDFKMSKNYNMWSGCLQSLRSEINSKFKKEEKEKASIYEKIARLHNENKLETKVTYEKKEVFVKEIDIYSLLYEYELWIGDMEEKYHFGMPDEEDARRALK